VCTTAVCAAGFPDAAIPFAPKTSTRWSNPYTAWRLLSMTVRQPLSWRSVTTAVSTSPTSAKLGSIRTPPSA
jgi:hypothetical protein